MWKSLLASGKDSQEQGSGVGSSGETSPRLGLIFSGSDLFFFSGIEVYFDRNKVIELPNCIHRGVRN